MTRPEAGFLATVLRATAFFAAGLRVVVRLAVVVRLRALALRALGFAAVRVLRTVFVVLRATDAVAIVGILDVVQPDRPVAQAAF